MDTDAQVYGGLAGAIVVEGGHAAVAGIAGSHENLVLLKDIGVDPTTGAVMQEGDLSANILYTVNGQVNPRIDSRPGERQLWRVGNLGNQEFFSLSLEGHPCIGRDRRHDASRGLDGQPVRPRAGKPGRARCRRGRAHARHVPLPHRRRAARLSRRELPRGDSGDAPGRGRAGHRSATAPRAPGAGRRDPARGLPPRERRPEAHPRVLGEATALAARRHHDVFDRLPKIASPTLVACGRYDGIAPPANSEAIVSRVPGAELRTYDGGHAFFIQDPSALPDVITFLSS